MIEPGFGNTIGQDHRIAHHPAMVDGEHNAVVAFGFKLFGEQINMPRRLFPIDHPAVKTGHEAHHRFKFTALPHARHQPLAHFGIGFSWGGFESLVVPSNPAEIRSATAWTDPDPLLRLSIGLEDPADLTADLERGFAALAA